MLHLSGVLTFIRSAIECKDWTDGQIKNNDSPNDIRDVDLTVVHVLSGPINVDGAEPGDILVVDLLDVGTLPDYEWGFTGIFSKENGGGFLTEHYPEARKAIWDVEGITTKSRHIPNVRFTGIPHPGLIGCAPSAELLAKWNKREAELFATDPKRVPPLAALPNPKNAILGSLKGAEYDRVAKEAARTVPPREHGGNCDIKNLSKGSRIYFPVYVKWVWSKVVGRGYRTDLARSGRLERLRRLEVFVEVNGHLQAFARLSCKREHHLSRFS